MTILKWWKSSTRYTKFGFIFLIIMVNTFILLILSPYLQNSIMASLDESYYQDALDRIETVRQGTIKVQFRYTNGTLATGIPVIFNHTEHEFLFGVKWFHYYQMETNETQYRYASLFTKVFNYAVLPFYWQSWESPDYYPEELGVNQTIAFCAQNGIVTKGHCLVWNNDYGIPAWLDPISNKTDTEIKAIFQNRITSLMHKYTSNISYWDVVNEMIHCPPLGTLNRAEFVRDCFIWARQAVPSAHLIYNDFGQMGHDYGHGEVARFYDRLNKINTPYDIIGMQSHGMDTDWITSYDIYWTLTGFQRLGKRIHITEAYAPSIRVPITNSWQKGVWTIEKQAEYIQRLYTVVFSHPVCDSIVWWEFEDGSSKVEKNEGYGILNHDLSIKPAYFMLDQLINREWHSEGQALTNGNGEIEFKGFYGKYSLTIEINATSIKNAEISVTKSGNNVFYVSLQ